MNRSRWRSLRTRISLLAIVTCIFLAIAVGCLYGFIRSSHTTTVSGAERHLSQVAVALAHAYSGQAAQGFSLRKLPTDPRPAGPPPPPPPLGADAGATPSPPPLPPDEALSRLTASVLQREEGIEGGFLAGRGPLVGYAFPTHESPGDHKEMPQRERPVIDQLAHTAEETGTAQSYAFEGPHDVVIFMAEPVRESVGGVSTITGSVWLMQRLPDINRGRSKQVLFASLGFAAAALVTALLAWFVTVEVNGGVADVTRRLASLEQDLSQPASGAQPRLAEFDHVLGGINALAVALQRRIANERSLEDQLRHKERLSSLGQFAAGVAHELRNPLATIRLRAQMSQHTAGDGVIARNSGVILEEVDRLDAMIGRLLYFARPISLSRETIDVGDLCHTVVRAWRDRAPAGVLLTCVSQSSVFVDADRSRLLQVLDNLVENAVQASQEQKGEVLIQVSDDGQLAKIDVMDRGSGFDGEALKHAFDPFFTTRDAGTGLGLSIAFELVTAHGGEVKAATREGGGAVLSILLPLSTSAAVLQL